MEMTSPVVVVEGLLTKKVRTLKTVYTGALFPLVVEFFFLSASMSFLRCKLLSGVRNLAVL